MLFDVFRRSWIGSVCRRSLSGVTMSSVVQFPTTLFEANGQEDPKIEYNLGRGAPGTDSLRHTAKLMIDATKHRMELELAGSASLLQYGAPQGDPLFLAELRKFLSEQYQDDVQYEDLVTTAGASSGFYYTLNGVFPNKCKVFCEQSTYMIAAEVLRYSQFELVPVDLDVDGINIEDLQSKLTVHLTDVSPNSDGLKAVLYLVPTFHNPTGRLTSPAKCSSIVSLARRHGLLVLCDDVYNLLYYGTPQPPKRLFAYDNKADPDYHGNVISNGSFSKYLTPGLRVGWMEVPKWFRINHWDKSAVLDSGGCLNPYTSGVLASALANGSVRDYVQYLRQEYKVRLDAVAGVLTTSLPAGSQVEIPQGGYFIWLRLPPPLRAKDLIPRCQAEFSVKCMPGSRFCADASKAEAMFGDCVRLSISYYSTPQLVEAVTRLCRAIHLMINTD